MAGDVIALLEEGRPPIVLTERKDHVQLLAEELRNFARHVVVLRGGMTGQQRRSSCRELDSPAQTLNSRYFAIPTESQEFADAIINDEELPHHPDAQQAQELMLAGTSMGGARPKTVVEDDDALWIAKFNRPDDKWNHARVESAMLALARECGIHTAESKLTAIGDRDALLVRRFDRNRTKAGYQRARMLSALTLLRAEDTHTNRAKWSYVLLVEELRRLSAQAKADGPELFRRMCFNALISNSDDHPRNHAVIAMENDWKLSPAYDLTPNPQLSIERRDLALASGDMGRYAHADNLLSQGQRFLVSTDDAKQIIDKMEQTVKERWRATARREGVSDADCEKISDAFAYEGFRLPITDQAVQ